MNTTFSKLNKFFLKSAQKINSIDMHFSEYCRTSLQGLQLSKQEIFDFTKELMNYNNFPQQVYGATDFGEPSFTLFSTEHLLLEILFWPKSNISIHNHAFSGAFKVLGDKVLHTEYSFNKDIDISHKISLGKLSLKNKSILNFGDTAEIKEYDNFIHSTYHKNSRGLTLVLRSPHNNIKELSRFFYTGVRLKSHSHEKLITHKKYQLYKYQNDQKIDKGFFNAVDIENLIVLYLDNVLERQDHSKLRTFLITKNIDNKIIQANKIQDIKLKEIRDSFI